MIKENQSLLNKINIATDIILLFAAMIISYFIRFFIFPAGSDYIKLDTYIRFTFIVIPIQLIVYGFFNLYGSFRSKPFEKECSLIIQANIIITAILLSLLFIFKFIHISRWLVIIFFFINIILVIIKRALLRKTLSEIRARGYNLKSLIILGNSSAALKYFDTIHNNKEYGYKYCGFIANSKEFKGTKLGNYNDLYTVLNQIKPDEAVCALDVKDEKYLKQIVSDCEKTGTKISIIPSCYEYIPSHPYIDQIDSIPLINIRRIPLDNVGNAFIKRTADIIGSFLLLILISPIMLFTAATIKLTSKGPVIFKQKRVGLNKQIFTMYKFRSMKINKQSDTAWSTDEDSRRTRFGSFIRKLSIDEFPQFWNVFKGDMSLVGPRPEIPHFVENFKETIPLYMVKHQIKPGITGLAQIKGFRGDTSIKKRIQYDIDYIENWNFFMDIQIIFKTVFKAFKNNEKL